MRESNSDKIEAYLDDWGRPNQRVGHRRWLLYPHLSAVGIAGTSRANVTTLFGSPFDAAAPNPAWVSWPTAGWFPSRLDPRGRWSLSSGGDDTDFANATVSVLHAGEPVPGIRLRTVDDGAGKPTLVWEMPRHLAEPAGRSGRRDRQRRPGRRRAGRGGVHDPVLPHPLTDRRRTTLSAPPDARPRRAGERAPRARPGPR